MEISFKKVYKEIELSRSFEAKGFNMPLVRAAVTYLNMRTAPLEMDLLKVS